MVSVKWLKGSEGQEIIRRVRMSSGADIDETLDATSLHVVADENGKPAAAGRLAIEGTLARIDGVCTHAGMEGEHIADMVVRMLLQGALRMGAVSVAIFPGEWQDEWLIELGFTIKDGVYQALAEEIRFHKCGV
ncbi:MAG: hypothetical protein Q8O09_00815 [Bacillota bacterium]|nr:hypothetical protein [Bacillota bacterium]